jgi:trigger factor
MPPEEFVQRIQQAGQLGAIYADVRRSKALIVAVREATVTDAAGGPVDLSDLLGDDDEQPAVVDGDVTDAAEDSADGAAEDTAQGTTAGTTEDTTEDTTETGDEAGDEVAAKS